MARAATGPGEDMTMDISFAQREAIRSMYAHGAAGVIEDGGGIAAAGVFGSAAGKPILGTHETWLKLVTIGLARGNGPCGIRLTYEGEQEARKPVTEIKSERTALTFDRDGTSIQRLSRVNAWYRVACTAINADVPMLGRILKLRVLEVHLTTLAEPATWVDWELSCILAHALGKGLHTSAHATPAFTASLDAARSFVAGTLPGFWVSSGLCALTGDASLGPDYNGPEGRRLHREWPLNIEGAQETWDEDLAPGDGPHRECMATLACAVRALVYQLEHQA